MKTRLVNSQLTSYKTYVLYKNQMLTLAKNVFEFKGLPESVDIDFMNSKLVETGSVVFFKDEVMDELVCLSYDSAGAILDVYGKPKSVVAHGSNGFRRTLTRKDKFVIMWDNNSYLPIYTDIVKYAERVAMCVRTQDVNIMQQRTPRAWKVPQDKYKSFMDMLNDIDGFVEKVIENDSVDINEIQSVLDPAPYVTDKIDDHLKVLWAEFFRLIGIANLQEQKRERVIRDEMLVSQGGTIASRFSRFEPRKIAIEKLNKMFGLKAEVRYYDGEPSSNESLEKGEEDVSDDVSNDANV